MGQVQSKVSFKSDTPACAVVAPQNFSTSFEISAGTSGETFITDFNPLVTAQEGLTITTVGCNPLVIKAEYIEDKDVSCGSCISDGVLSATTVEKYFYLNSLPSSEFASKVLPSGWWVDLSVVALSTITGDPVADYATGLAEGAFAGVGQAFEVDSITCAGCCELPEVTTIRGTVLPVLASAVKKV